MATYYYQFALTSSTINTQPISNSESYDISEFNNDSRGTARVADWSDLPTSESAYDIFVEVLGLSNDSNGLVSWDNRASSYQNGSKWYWVSNSRNRFFYFINNNTNTGAALHQNTSIASGKKLSLGSWSGNRRALVYFPNYQANGGHSTLVINNSITTTWDSTNKQFSSSGGSTTLSHNGTTWAINNNGTTSTASLNSSNVGSHVDPASSDIVWQNDSSATIPSAGAQGDPHINPILGSPYTI